MKRPSDSTLRRVPLPPPGVGDTARLTAELLTEFGFVDLLDTALSQYSGESTGLVFGCGVLRRSLVRLPLNLVELLLDLLLEAALVELETRHCLGPFVVGHLLVDSLSASTDTSRDVRRLQNHVSAHLVVGPVRPATRCRSTFVELLYGPFATRAFPPQDNDGR